MAESPAVDHALALLSLLAREPEPLPASVLARALGRPRSSTYRLLTVLADRGFVSYLPEQHRYGLGVAVFELGAAYQRQAPLARIARPSLDRLVDETAQHAHLAVLHGRDVYYVIEARARGRQSLVTDVGVRLPATLTASGLAMLAELPAAQIRALFPSAEVLVRRNDRGPARVSELRRMLTDVRARGYAQEEETITDGFSSVARAVCDHTGHPVAAVTVTYVTTEVDEAGHAAIVAAVNRAVVALTRRLHGSRPHPSGLPDVR
jgi:DNA-binding IclR family transcriptional regulator